MNSPNLATHINFKIYSICMSSSNKRLSRIFLYLYKFNNLHSKLISIVLCTLEIKRAILHSNTNPIRYVYKYIIPKKAEINLGRQTYYNRYIIILRTLAIYIFTCENQMQCSITRAPNI